MLTAGTNDTNRPSAGLHPAYSKILKPPAAMPKRLSWLSACPL
jgi:hypothetical protein